VRPRGEGIFRAAAGALPTLLFLAILLVRIPLSVSRALSSYSIPLFIGVLVLYYIAFQAPAKWHGTAAISLTMLLLALSLSFLWHSGYSDDKIVAGLLPFRDAFDYFNGADWLLSGHVIRTINEGAAWRPLYPGLLATLLWITGRNLQWALAIQVWMAGMSFALAASYVRNRIGAAAGAAFITLMYFYIQPLIGTAYTETIGLALGCLALVVLWESARSKNTPLLIGGLALLMLAVSERAGAFFVFPLLVVWAGWAWRGEERFAWRQASLALGTVVIGYAAFNMLFSKLVVEPGGYPFGNFAFTLYGQVNGGAGYHKAFEDLGVRNPALIMRAAERFFLAHPQGFAVGAAKAYRDFFSPMWGVFSYGNEIADGAFWLAATALLLYGLYRLVRRIGEAEASLLVAAFVGIVLSIPFLPPIDGGVRIYASTMPFIYAIAAWAIARLWPRSSSERPVTAMPTMSEGLGALIGVMMVIVPVVILHMTPQPQFEAASCPADQVPYAVAVSGGSYVDLVPGDAPACGRVPSVCLEAFRPSAATSDPSDAAVFNQLATAAEQDAVRVLAGNDLIGGRPHLFVGLAHELAINGRVWISGCATETQVKGRPSIYTIQSMTAAASAK
jgi:hypothetical protein